MPAAGDGLLFGAASISVGKCVFGQPLVHQRVGRGAAHAVASDGDEERLPFQSEGTQRLVRHDRRYSRDITEQRDFSEAVAGAERRPGLPPTFTVADPATIR